MTALEKFGPLLGRILIALLFVPAGITKITGFGDTVGYISSVGLPLPQAGAVLAIVIELGLGLALLVGFKARYAALGLAVFTAAASLFFHNFWAVPDPQMAFMQQLLFFKNVAVVGGLLGFAANGPGAYALDTRAKA